LFTNRFREEHQGREEHMANERMSVEEMLAYCRQADGEGGEPAAETPEPVQETPVAETPPPEPVAEKKPAPAPKKLAPGERPSIQDMLAMARAQDGGEKSAPPAAETPAPAAKEPPAKKPASGGRPSVQEMLAQARAKDGGAKKTESPKPAAKAPSKPAPAKKAAAKAKPEPAKSSGPKDTSSVLAGDPKQAKPGPMSKAEAAAKGKPVGKPKVKREAPPMPAKPSYAKPAPSRPTVDEGRRTITGMLGAGFSAMVGTSLGLGFTSLAATSGLWTLGMARFMFPNVIRQPPTKFKVGVPTDFAPDSVETKYKAQFGIWVVNAEYEGQRQIYALSTVCTHLGCTPNWLEGEQKFKCPCHGSGFYKSGVNFEGPAPRPLERYAVSIADDGQLEVDKSKKFQQEMGQWKEASSFVPV
ncbi:MAG: Rieske 2Fe-2S domain-containing protein, partial [Planctomycetales bacterium]